MQGRTRDLVLILFFLSGACTLVYEVVWMRMLVLVFGMSIYAVSTVLTVFMAGLALGSATFGRLVDRKGHGLRIYAYLELGIGVFALAFPFILAGLDDIYTALYRNLQGNAYAYALIRFLLGFLVLLVPTTLMGATLPVLTKFFVRRLPRIGRGVGDLYAINTFGAAAGCFAAAYVLMEFVGTTGTTWVAAAVNLLIAGVAFVISLKREEADRPPAPPEEPEARFEPEVPVRDPRIIRLIFWGFALSGFTALGYEVIWTRLLCIVLHVTTIQSVSTILIAFLVGLAAGGAIGARFVDRRSGLLAVFGVVEILLGLFALASIAVLGGIPRMLHALGSLPDWTGHILRLFIVAFGVMLIPMCLMGLLFPVVGKLHVPALRSMGTRIGNIYAANTTGAIFGAFVAGFVLVPFIGTQMSIQWLAWINIVLGAVVLALDPVTRIRTKLAVAGGLAVPILALTLLLPSTFMVDLIGRSEPGSKLLFYDEGAAGTVTVHEFPDGKRLLKVNGAGEVPTDRASIRTFRLLGNLPMVLHPAPEDVVVIAFGGGVTLAAVEAHHPRRLDCVEVAPGVFEAARYFSRYNNDIFERLDAPDIEIIIDDGRNHVLRTERRYNVIISDATHPATADSWVLYTEEFYRLCKERLKTDGVIAQWLPLHGLAAEDYRIIVRTFKTVYPHASLWVTKDYSVLLGTPARLQIDFDRLEAKLGGQTVNAMLAEVDLEDPISFLAALALDEDAVATYVGSGRINTDDRPYISFADRHKAGTGSGLPALVSLLPYLTERVDGYMIDADGSDTQRLERRLLSRRHAFQGEIALKSGDRQRALAELRQARRLDPGEREAATLLSRLEGDHGEPGAGR